MKLALNLATFDKNMAACRKRFDDLKEEVDK